ncbi:MAG: hypothetical protein AAF206_14900 [Bacteroidota bacterium]
MRIFYILLIYTMLVSCDAMQFPGREYAGEYSGTMVRMDNRLVSDGHGGPSYFESDTTILGEVSFILEGEPWSNVYTY